MKEEFLNARQSYQTLLRNKKTDYFKKTTTKDFKETQQFWSLHSCHFKLKSDKSTNTAPSAINVNGKKISDKKEIANEFNKFFSLFASEPNVETIDCKSFTFDNFKSNMNLSNNCNFKFIHTTESEVTEYLLDIDNKSSAGSTGIPIAILKSCKLKIGFVPLIHAKRLYMKLFLSVF